MIVVFLVGIIAAGVTLLFFIMGTLYCWIGGLYAGKPLLPCALENAWEIIEPFGRLW